MVCREVRNVTAAHDLLVAQPFNKEPQLNILLSEMAVELEN